MEGGSKRRFCGFRSAPRIKEKSDMGGGGKWECDMCVGKNMGEGEKKSLI